MKVTEFKSVIMSNKYDKVYLFNEQDSGITKIYIEQMGKSFEAISHMDTVRQVYNSCKSKSFVKKHTLYIVRDDMEFVKEEKTWAEIEKVLGDNVLIYISDKFDKRGKFYKHYIKQVVDFEKLDRKILTNYVRQYIPLTPTRAEWLCEICEDSYSRCMIEADKIMAHAHATNNSFDDSLNILVKDGTITVPPKDAIFDLIDAILSCNLPLTYELLDNCERVGEATLVEITVLYNNCKQLLQVQSSRTDDIAKETGLTPWQIKCSKQRQGVWKNKDLVCMLKLLINAEKGIKTGEIPDAVAFQKVLVDFMYG